jgi:oligosaccharide repeat unit polymerase
LVFFSYIKFRKVINPFSIVFIWTLGWYIVSKFSFTGLYKPSVKCSIVVSLAVLGIMIGAFFYNKTKLEKNIIVHLNQHVEDIFKKLLRFIFIISYPITGFYSIKALLVINKIGLENYRRMAFSYGVDQPSVVFGNSYIDLLYTIIISPINFLSMFLSFVIFVQKRENSYLVFSFVLVTLESIIRLGRFSIYYFAWCLILTLILSNKEKILNKYLKKKIYKFSLLCLLFIVIIGGVRGKELDITKQFRDYVIEYHTVGFVLFDKELSNQDSRLNKFYTYGLASIGGIEKLFKLVIVKIVPSYHIPSNDNGTEWDKYVPVGQRSNGEIIIYNAFYTSLYSMYMDGREFFVFFFCILVGYFLCKHYLLWDKLNDSMSLALLLLLMNGIIFSIFSSRLESTSFWLALIYLLIIKKYILYTCTCNDVRGQ